MDEDQPWSAPSNISSRRLLKFSACCANYFYYCFCATSKKYKYFILSYSFEVISANTNIIDQQLEKGYDAVNDGISKGLFANFLKNFDQIVGYLKREVLRNIPQAIDNLNILRNECFWTFSAIFLGERWIFGRVAVKLTLAFSWVFK